MCDPRCSVVADGTTCYGPSQRDCAGCVEFAYRTHDGECECLPDRDAETGCTTYSGKCDPKCNGCSGPAAS